MLQPARALQSTQTLNRDLDAYLIEWTQPHRVLPANRWLYLQMIALDGLQSLIGANLQHLCPLDLRMGRSRDRAPREPAGSRAGGISLRCNHTRNEGGDTSRYQWKNSMPRCGEMVDICIR